MSTQPIDRSKAKHAIKTAPRNVPAMVNRSNKQIKPDHLMAGPHEFNAPRLGGGHVWRIFHKSFDFN